MANYAVVVLDETGSMAGQEERVVTSMNEYAETMKKAKARMTVFCFDSERWRVFFDDKASKWKPMTVEDYNPGQMTPLYDAIGKAIGYMEKIATHNYDKVHMMVDTDGYENASEEFTFEVVTGLIEGKQAAGWKFVFMAAGVDKGQVQLVGSQGRRMGMQVNSTLHSQRGATYRAASGQTMSYFDDEATTTDGTGSSGSTSTEGVGSE